MKELREIERLKHLKILHEGKTKDGDTMSVLTSWIQAGKENKNNRIYPKSLLNREVSRVQKAVESGAFIGTGDHAASGFGNIETSSHLIKKIWMDESGRGWMEMKILPTPRGKTIQTLIKQGAQLGVSARGFGTVDEKTKIVRDDYRLAGVDIVVNPSEPTATFNRDNIFESVDFEKKKEEEIVKKDLKPKTIEAIKKMTTKEPKKPKQKVRAQDVWVEAKLAGIPASEYARRINEGIDAGKEIEAEKDLAPEQTLKLLREAQRAGFDISDKKVRARIIESAKMTKDSKPKTLTEEEKKNLKGQALFLEKQIAGVNEKSALGDKNGN